MTLTTLTAPSLLVLIKWTEPTVLKQEKTHWETARESSSGNRNNWLKWNYKQTNKQRHVKHVPGASFKPSAFHYLLIHTAAEQSTGGLAYVAHSGWGPQRLANQHLPHAWIQGRPRINMVHCFRGHFDSKSTLGQPLTRDQSALGDASRGKVTPAGITKAPLTR